MGRTRLTRPERHREAAVQISMPSKMDLGHSAKVPHPQQPLLAHDKVRHVGEAIAIIVAESRE